MASLLRARENYQTFSNRPISVDSLAVILWAAHGVTRRSAAGDSQWHRSIEPVASAHCARWFVLVLRPLPANDERSEGLAPGLYECQFHVEGGASFERAALMHGTEAWRLLPDPRPLNFASALIIPLCDVAPPARVYGHRATLAVGVEVGQSLQNAQLMAPSLGVACMVQGEMVPDALMELLEPHLGHETDRTRQILAQPSLLLGMRPSSEEAEREQAARWMKMRQASASPTSAGIPSPIAAHAFVAGPVRVGSSDVYTGGRSADPKEASVKAEAEAWERLGWATLGVTAECRAMDLDDALDPRTIVAYTRAQYDRKDFPWTPYSTGKKYSWVSGVDTQSGARVLLPSECIHALNSLPAQFRQRAYTNVSTSGVAAWTDQEGALCRAAMELVERDAFLRAWIAQAPVPQMACNSLPGTALQRIKWLENAGYRVAVMQLASTLAPVFAVFLQSTARPFTAITAAADLQAEVALTRALDEGEGRAIQAAAFPAKPLRRTADVSSLEDINRLYQSPRFYRRADFFAAGPLCQRFGTGPRRCNDWAQVKKRLAQEKRRLLAFDLTPGHASVNQGRTPLHVVRAVIPGLIPIWFQPGLEPAGLSAYQSSATSRTGRAARADSPCIHPFT